MLFLRAFAVLMLLAAGPAPSRADDNPSPEAVAAASELLSLMSPDLTRQFTSQMVSTFWPQVEERARTNNIDDATIAEMRAVFERAQLDFVTSVMKDAPPVYARHFTIAELHDLTAFYRTPTGAKALRELPEVMADIAGLIVPRLPQAQEKISAAFDKILHDHGYQK